MVSKELIEKTERFLAKNYSPLEVVIRSGEGVWVTDVDGRRYLDMLAAYSALNFGHRHPRLIRTAHEQLDKLTLTSRAFYSEEQALLGEELAKFCAMDRVLIMNSGAEAVETAIKMTRKWGYEIKGIPEDRAEILVFEGNFHGRTTTIVSFSTSPSSSAGFGPYGGGFRILPFGDADAVERAITPHTAGVLIEPILGEGGVILPPEGFLKRLRTICSAHNVLLLADEIQTGLCRTGKVFACEHEGVKPDALILGKSLGGGIVPISAVAATSEVMSVFKPGTHGSTFGGNPFACAIAREVLRLITDEKPHERAAVMGDYFAGALRGLIGDTIEAVRSKGLFIGADVRSVRGTGKKYCSKLKDEGVLCKDTRDQTIRFAPPLTITREELDWGLERITRVLR